MKLTATLVKTWLLAASLAAAPFALAVPPRQATPMPTEIPDEDAPDPATITLPGTVIERPQGKGYLSLTLEGGAFKLNFYDSRKQPIAPDVTRAAAHWNPKQKFGEERAVLNLTSDGQSLKGDKFVQPPFPINVFITLLSEEGVGVESHTVAFRP